MRQKHKNTIEKFGAELIRIIPRQKRGDALAYIVRKYDKEWRWSISQVDREVPPWELDRKQSIRYKYGNDNYIYRMFDRDGRLLYIGKTAQLDYRMYTHFYKYREEWKELVEYIDAHRFDNEADMHIYEMYLITKYKPVFNRHASCSQVPSFEFPELDFSEVTDWG